MSEQGREGATPAGAAGQDSAPAPQAPKRKSGSDLPRSWPGMLVLMLFAGLIGGGVATYWRNPAAIDGDNRLGAVEETLSMLGSRLTMAEARLDALEAAPQQAADGAAVADDGGLEFRLGTLESRLAQSNETLGTLAGRLESVERTVPPNLAERLNAFALRSEQSQLDARLAGLEATSSAAALRRAAVVLALADLSRAAMEARPFTVELDALAAASPGDSAIPVLRPHADSGVPTTLQLAARFGDAARAALAAERASAGDGFWTRLWNGLTGLVSVRRVGNVEGDDSQSRLARAEVALAMTDLAAAVGEVRALQGAAADAMADWLGDAEARLAVERAVAGINARVVAELAAVPPPSATPAQQNEADTGP